MDVLRPELANHFSDSGCFVSLGGFVPMGKYSLLRMNIYLYQVFIASATDFFLHVYIVKRNIGALSSWEQNFM